MTSTTAIRPARTRLDAWSEMPVREVLARFAKVLHSAFIFFACFAFSEASPYDIVAIPTIVLWFLLGLRLHRGILPLVWLLILYLAAIGISLIPYLDEPVPVTWTIQLYYLALTGVFFAMLFSEDTHDRMSTALKTYMASCVFSAALGIIGYFQVLGIEDLFSRYGRASGSFADPNVFGSYLILGLLYLIHSLLLGTAKRPLLSLIALFVVLAGILLSFSRGSWGGTIAASALMIVSTYASSRSPALRRRIVVLSAVTVVLCLVALLGLLSVDSVSKTFENRASVTQDYDEGETGRFGNQMRGMAMLAQLPFGMGPLHWRLIFNLEPHNSYIGSFANGGWLGGAVFILLVISTTFVGVRLLIVESPFRRYAQVVFPALLMFFLQGMQIDIEKWRHVYMMLGMIWGLEAARLRWLARSNAQPRTASQGHRHAGMPRTAMALSHR